MLVSLKIDTNYEGFLFLAESVRNPPILVSHRHEELELNLVAKGEISYIVDGCRYTSGPGTLLWFFPEQEHQLISRTPDAEYFVAVFKPGLIERACRTAAYAELKEQMPKKPEMLHSLLEPQSFEWLKAVMRATMEESIDADILNREGGFGVKSSFRYRHNDPDALNAGLRFLLLVSWRLHQSAIKKASQRRIHPSVQRALILISESNLEMSQDAVAAKCGVSAAYLSRLFTKQVGIPMSRYQNSVRLGRFWDLYSGETSVTVTEAMLEAGFGSYAQFFKVFTAEYGKGPRALLRDGWTDSRSGL